MLLTCRLLYSQVSTELAYVLIDYVSLGLFYNYYSRMHFTGWRRHYAAAASHIVTDHQSVI